MGKVHHCICQREKNTLTHNSLGNQHVVQSHELRVGRVDVLDIAVAKNHTLLDLTEDGE